MRSGQKLKTPWHDGTTHLVMSPLEFMQRLAALVPRPRPHLIRFRGVLAPNAKLRAMVVPQPVEPAEPGPAGPGASAGASARAGAASGGPATRASDDGRLRPRFAAAQRAAVDPNDRDQSVQCRFRLPTGTETGRLKFLRV